MTNKKGQKQSTRKIGLKENEIRATIVINENTLSQLKTYSVVY